MTRPAVILLLAMTAWAAPLQARNELITVPVILADYYGFAYYQAYEDRAFPYAWGTAGADALGWGIVLAAKKQSGLFLVNLAGVSKTLYPLVRLADGDCPMEVRRRAWTSVGTHAGTLLFLRFAGKPAVRIYSWTPASGGEGLRLAWGF